MELLSVSHAEAPESEALGELGERLAADFLISRGFRIVLRNFKVPIGRNSKGVARTGEIDIIALEGETLCFIEVKTRTSEEVAPAIRNVDLRKRVQITRTARMYRAVFDIRDVPVRYDVVTVLIPERAEPTLQLVRNFWTEASLRSRPRREFSDNIPY